MIDICVPYIKGVQNASFNVWIVFLSVLFLRVPHCPCLGPAAGKAWETAVTLTTGERGTALVTVCRATPSSPLLSAAQRGSRTNLVSSAYFYSIYATKTDQQLR